MSTKWRGRLLLLGKVVVSIVALVVFADLVAIAVTGADVNSFYWKAFGWMLGVALGVLVIGGFVALQYMLFWYKEPVVSQRVDTRDIRVQLAQKQLAAALDTIHAIEGEIERGATTA